MSIENPESLSENTGKNVFEYIKGDEYPNWMEQVSHFDEAREMTYAQVGMIMNGGGGDTGYEAQEKLEKMVIQTAVGFSHLGMAILKEFDNQDEAIMNITSLYSCDERDRIQILRNLNAEAEYEPVDPEKVFNDLKTYIPELDDEQIESMLEGMYGNGCSLDINLCLDEAPDNEIEAEADKQRLLRDRAKKILFEAGRMAVSGLIAAALVNRFNKKN